jgi:hypothetical protein
MIAVKSKNDFGVHSVQLGQYVFGHCTTLWVNLKRVYYLAVPWYIIDWDWFNRMMVAAAVVV